MDKALDFQKKLKIPSFAFGRLVLRYSYCLMT